MTNEEHILLRNPRFRIEVIQEILNNGKRLPIQLAHMDDQTAWEFLKAYYSYETYLITARFLVRKGRKQ